MTCSLYYVIEFQDKDIDVGWLYTQAVVIQVIINQVLRIIRIAVKTDIKMGIYKS